MKNLQSKSTQATLALLGAGILGGLAPISVKIVLRELPPITISFLRLTLALIVLFPLAVRSFPHIFVHWKRLVLVGLFYAGNVFLFTLGIKYTTSAVSQLLYGGVPLLMLLEQSIGGEKRLHARQLTGIFLGIVGTVILIVHPGSGGVDFGTRYGNTLIFLATLSWSFYLLITKRVSSYVPTLGLTFGMTAVAWCIGLLLMNWLEGAAITGLFSLSLAGWLSLLFVGIVVGVGMWFLYNWGIKHGSTVVASSMLYVSTVTAGIGGYIAFGETITATFLLGGAILVSGVYLISRAHSQAKL